MSAGLVQDELQICVGADSICDQTPEQKQAQSPLLQEDWGPVRAAQFSAQAGREPYWSSLVYCAETSEAARLRPKARVRMVAFIVMGCREVARQRCGRRRLFCFSPPG